MPAPIIPWQPSNIPSEIQDELNRRKVNRSFVYVNSSKGDWDKADEAGRSSGDWIKYRGPMTPWVRFCSNGYGREKDLKGNPLPSEKIKPGFVFFGGKNFYDGYGFAKNTNGTPESIIGYLPDGIQTHTIENDFRTSHYPIHFPSPEIERISITIQKELYRRATVEWVCFSKTQLEYMTPYFLVPGLSCILEWGWNHFDPKSLLDLTDEKTLKEFNNNPYPLYTDHILSSKGNYDVLFGRITHFEWSVEGNKFKCKTEITSQDRIYAGLAVDSNSVYSNVKKGAENEIRPFGSLVDFINKNISAFKEVRNFSQTPVSIPGLKDIVTYVYNHHSPKEDKDRWRKYIYGVFFGRSDEKSIGTNKNSLSRGSKGSFPNSNENSLSRGSKGSFPNIDRDSLSHGSKGSFPNIDRDSLSHGSKGSFPNATPTTTTTSSTTDNITSNINVGADTTYDFDYQAVHDDLWLNMGLVIEIINYHVQAMKSFKQDEIFRVDIDDVVISAHPNLISGDGYSILIPNASAPKYFQGKYALDPKDLSFPGGRLISQGIFGSPLEDVGPITVDIEDAFSKLFGTSIPGKSITHTSPGVIRNKEQDLLSKAKTQEERQKIKDSFAKEAIEKREAAEKIRIEALLQKKDLEVMKNCDVMIEIKDYETAKKNKSLADYRLFKVCGQSGGAYRDNLDELINDIRYKNTTNNEDHAYAFPFFTDKNPEMASKLYPAKYSGYLKDIYINTKLLKKLVNDTGIKTYVNFIERLLSSISEAAGGFWDFRLVSGSGRGSFKKDGSAAVKTVGPATMKIIDDRFINTANTGVPYTFDYFDSDSLLLGLNFKPTLSNAQAIRTIYAQTNQPDRNVTVVNGDNELLDYKFKDRLIMDDNKKDTPSNIPIDTEFAAAMNPLQKITPPPPGSYQMTNKRAGGQTLIRRLAIPYSSSSQLLKLLLDDGDEELNPKYTGIMPGIQASFTIQGIGGLRTFMMFLVRNLPEPYSHENIVFRIVDVQETIEAGKWTTVITAGIIPLREHIKVRLNIPVSSKTN